MGVTRLLSITEKILIVLVAFGVVVYARVAWMEWSEDFTKPFLMTGNYLELIFIFLAGMIIATVLTKLLQFEIRSLTKPRQIKFYRRRR